MSDLNATGARQTDALEDLRKILLRAAHYTFNRYLVDLRDFPSEQIASLSEDCAQEALVSVLSHLQEFRGESRFTTWAYKFAVNIALMSARRERQKFTPLELVRDGSGSYDWFFKTEDKPFSDPELSSLKKEIGSVIRSVIQNDLTPKQQEILKLMVFEEVPMDEVVERLKTNRNAVYKLLHDARLKIKTRLQARGIKIEDAIHLFSMKE